MNTRQALRLLSANLRSAERRARSKAKVQKAAFNRLGAKRRARPVFIAGMQRSGTTMLMNVFYLHPSMAVYDETADSAVFCDFRIRDWSVLHSSLESQTLPVAVYKVICDSHLVSDLLREFPDALVLWVYRNPMENAESQLKAFPEPVRAIKLIHADKPGGGWLAEGASGSAVCELREFDAKELSDFDWACLNWWLRNRIVQEQDLVSHPRVRLLRYEELARDPGDVLGQVMDWLDVPHNERSMRFVHSKSVHKDDLPRLHAGVEKLCQSLLDSLNEQQRFLAVRASTRGSLEA